MPGQKRKRRSLFRYYETFGLFAVAIGLAFCFAADHYYYDQHLIRVLCWEVTFPAEMLLVVVVLLLKSEGWFDER